ncbi:FAD-binding oxidoreductase [Confluentibacter citreus]|uniref:FAD-binding oxidoreductase n=1 Tax=Confluentibacter citreus TaxID=2007307 RepID=UPI001EFE32FC|nr:FAD-binding oxidoreductase [Confluentibacter citreus]
MFEVSLRNNKVFKCDSESTILSAAKKAGLVLEHSCLSARCRSCIVKVIKGDVENIQEELVLSKEERNTGYVLSCNAKPLSNIKLDIEDLGDIVLTEPSVFPSKIDTIEKVKEDIIKLVLRFPPTCNFKFIAGQYVNIIKDNIKRSYSIANNPKGDNKLEFYIKKYNNGVMSDYFFSKAKENDLLRIEGPLGTFFYRNDITIKNIIFLATGTGIAPVKALLEQFNQQPEIYKEKKIWLFFGVRYKEDIFFNPKYDLINFTFIPVLSRKNVNWQGENGYIQNVLLKQKIDLSNAQVYACGSNDMILSAKKVLIENNLKEHNFYSDAFVSSN